MPMSVKEWKEAEVKGYDDVFLTEIKKDGTEEVLRNSEEHNFKERKNNG